MSSRHPEEPVFVLRREQTGFDRYGDPVYSDVEKPLPDALFAPGGTSEPVEPGREPVVMEPTLYWRNKFPDVVSSDRLRVRGQLFDVDGEPAVWRGRRTGGTTVTLRRVKEAGA